MTSLTTKAGPQIFYRTGFKYQLAAEYRHQLSFRVPAEFTSHLFYCTGTGLLIIQTDYAWDGASGPTRDTKNSMRASLVHDVLYQAIREKVLPESFRPMADAEFWFITQQDGMRWWRAMGWFFAVRRFGEEAATKVRKVLTAPY